MVFMSTDLKKYLAKNTDYMVTKEPQIVQIQPSIIQNQKSGAKPHFPRRFFFTCYPQKFRYIKDTYGPYLLFLRNPYILFVFFYQINRFSMLHRYHP